jgi:ABC-type tungstate transport system permease subunit
MNERASLSLNDNSASWYYFELSTQFEITHRTLPAMNNVYKMSSMQASHYQHLNKSAHQKSVQTQLG